MYECVDIVAFVRHEEKKRFLCTFCIYVCLI